MKKLLFLGGILVSAAAVAQSPSANGGQGGSNDPNQTVCRSIPNTGSRVSRSRICMTRAQWDERRRDMRSTIERGQLNRNNNGNGG
jgi:hypothetical protein